MADDEPPARPFVELIEAGRQSDRGGRKQGPITGDFSAVIPIEQLARFKEMAGTYEEMVLMDEASVGVRITPPFAGAPGLVGIQPFDSAAGSVNAEQPTMVMTTLAGRMLAQAILVACDEADRGSRR